MFIAEAYEPRFDRLPRYSTVSERLSKIVAEH